jgi:hypothetical protein
MHTRFRSRQLVQTLPLPLPPTDDELDRVQCEADALDVIYLNLLESEFHLVTKDLFILKLQLRLTSASAHNAVCTECLRRFDLSRFGPSIPANVFESRSFIFDAQPAGSR